jgi:hypothetical protein
MEPDEPLVFVGMRVSELPTPHVPSLKGRCEVCHEAIWISKGSLSVAVTAQRTVCVQCMLLEIGPPDGRFH